MAPRGTASWLVVLCGAVGVAMLCHSAVLTASYRESLKLSGEPFSLPPPPALFELLVGFLLSLYAGVNFKGSFVPISVQADSNRCVSLSDNLDFMAFNHRGAALPNSLVLKFKAKQL